jgi:hypothetical protein
LGTEGFGYYSADLLTLINPMGSSRVLPTWPTGPGQYEGFGYVGGGVLVLCVIGIVISWHKPGVIHGCWIQEWVPLAACCVLLTAFAFSSTVTIAGIPILELGTLYRPVIEIVMPFRTSGRFIWPLHYFVITGVLAILIRQQKSSQFTLIVILVTTVIIQLLDIRVYPFRQYLKEAQREEENLLNIDGWQYIGGQYEHIVLYPPHLWSTTSCTIQEYILNYYVPLAYQAYKLNLTFNSGYFARIDGEKVQRYCNDLGRQVREGEIQADTIYVVHISHWNVFKKNTTKIACGRTREYIACISAQRYDAFREFLTSHEFPADP